MPTKTARHIAANVKRLRGKRTQRDVAEAAGLDVMRISDMERGARPGWTIDTLEKVAAALKTTVSELTKEN